MKPLVYTTVVRGYQQDLYPLPKSVRGVALVDQYFSGRAEGWELKRVEDVMTMGPELSRFFKMLPHRTLPLHVGQISIYVDSAFEPIGDVLYLAKKLPKDKDVLLLRHPGREFPLQEVHALRHPARQLITQEQVHRVLGYWEQYGFTGENQIQPIGGVIVRRHTARASHWGALWFRHFLNLCKHARVCRDQLTLALSLEQAKIEPTILDIDYYRSKGWGFRYHTKDREHEMNERRKDAEESRQRKAWKEKADASRKRKEKAAKRQRKAEVDASGKRKEKAAKRQRKAEVDASRKRKEKAAKRKSKYLKLKALKRQQKRGRFAE